MEQWFADRVALVTGAASGIGRAAALLYAKRGAAVGVVDVDSARGSETVEIIRAGNGRACFIHGDVGDPAAARDFVGEVVRTFGRLDCAFNNAGVQLHGDGEWDEAAFDRTLAINLQGAMRCMKAEIAVMLDHGGGTIVNTASTSSFTASAIVPLPAYTTSKHALIGLTRTAALQYARRGIRVNAICPGVTDTDIIRGIAESSPEARDLLNNFAPMGRMGRPEEMAEAAIWMSSDLSAFVTGHALVIDGGFLAT